MVVALLLALAPLKIVMPAPLGVEQARKDAAALGALLGAALHREVVAQVAAPKEIAALLASGSADLGWLSAGQYVDASAKGVTPVAKLIRGGMPFYRSALFVKANGGPRRLNDLKGKRFAFVSQQSSAGYLLARRMLTLAGFTAADLRGEKFLGDHAAVCRAVLEGRADAGATFANDGRGGRLAGCEETLGAGKAREFRVLASSDPIPNDLVAVRPQAPLELVDAVREALLGLAKTPDGKAQLESIFHADGFVPAEDADYAPLRAERTGK